MPITTCVFDAYGTLFDVTAAAREAAGQPEFDAISDSWPKLAANWRLKQLQYSWLRAITGTMQRNADELAAHATARTPEAFRTILGGDASGTHPVYDLWLRMRGRGTAIDLSHRSEKDSAT